MASDHPRACGELHDSRSTAHAGSSPRMRGTRLVPCSPHHASNIGSSPRMRGTRALRHALEPDRPYTGSSPRMRGTLRCSEDHGPRVCTGSSPRMRGTLSRSDQRGPDHPRACGELVRRVANTEYSSDHPRACGELSSFGAMTRQPDHPRACGELDGLSAYQAVVSRIIPAHAGNSATRGREPYVEWSSVGSSPRMRGTRMVHPRPPAADHPRACGELQGSPNAPDP